MGRASPAPSACRWVSTSGWAATATCGSVGRASSPGTRTAPGPDRQGVADRAAHRAPDRRSRPMTSVAQGAGRVDVPGSGPVRGYLDQVDVVRLLTFGSVIMVHSIASLTAVNDPAARGVLM